MKTTLVTVVTGAIYEKFAEDLFASAGEFFHPTEEVELVMLEGRPGWPDATMYRHHALARFASRAEADFLFMSDADMLFVDHVDGGILPTQGITATLHPGYVHTGNKPYELRPESACALPLHSRGHYYCGGFVGGTTEAMHDLSVRIAMLIDLDEESGITPVWHDESALNRLLFAHTPEVGLSPSYCYPENDNWYRTVWPEQYERKLVALDKTEAQRGIRD